MRFFLHEDLGHKIKGWVVPDNPVAISRVHVSVEGRRVAEVSAAFKDETFRALGWHSTGQCHFEVNEETVPGLDAIPTLEIHDVDTNVLIYRRSRAEGLVNDRLVLVNTSINPESVIEAALYPHFRQSYFGIGKFPEETLQAMFDTASLTSALMSGSILFPRYEGHFVQAETLTTMLVHDPYVELATRLLWLRERADIALDAGQSWRLGALAEAAAFTAEYDYTDVKSLKRLFRMLPEPAYHLLYNPLTRQLSTRLPDDRVLPAASITAVEVLARIAIVGHRDYFEAYMATLLDRLGIKAPIPGSTPIPAEALDLAERLRTIKVAREMVTFDAVISGAVRNSVAKSWAS